jgi:hypothetical protein
MSGGYQSGIEIIGRDRLTLGPIPEDVTMDTSFQLSMNTTKPHFEPIYAQVLSPW